MWQVSRKYRWDRWACHVLMGESVGPQLGAGMERLSLVMVVRAAWGGWHGEVAGVTVQPGWQHDMGVAQGWPRWSNGSKWAWPCARGWHGQSGGALAAFVWAWQGVQGGGWWGVGMDWPWWGVGTGKPDDGVEMVVAMGLIQPEWDGLCGQWGIQWHPCRWWMVIPCANSGVFLPFPAHLSYLLISVLQLLCPCFFDWHWVWGKCTWGWRCRAGGCVHFTTGFWGGMGGFQVSSRDFLTGFHTRFVERPC